MDPAEIIKQVIEIAKRAGEFIRKERSDFDQKRVEIKGKNDLVSYVDKTAEQMIIDGLKPLLPDAGFIAEENTASGKKEYNWIIDPLDGTTNFVHGIPCYAVSIALEHKGEIIIGVVYEVSRDECFYAHKGGKAFLNGKEIQVSQTKILKDALIATGFPVNNFSRLQPNLGALAYFMQNTHGVRRIGSAATDLCYLACGRVDAFFEYNLNAWDVAAGILIVQEAGGKVTDFKGGKNFLFGREIAASNGTLQQEFQKVISEKFKE
ncbi:MAG: inositol monophosphatase family protein [Bacteroidia bacterium]